MNKLEEIHNDVISLQNVRNIYILYQKWDSEWVKVIKEKRFLYYCNTGKYLSIPEIDT